MTDRNRNRRRLIIAAALVVVAVIDWFTLDIGVLKPLVVGAGSLEVHSDANGAEVLLDGVARGMTPVRLPRLLAGSYTLQVRHRFHPPHVREVLIERGVDHRVTVQLEPAFGELAMATNPKGAAITLNGERLAEVTPTTLEQIVAGEYELVFEIFGRKTITQVVAVLPNERREIVAELNRLDMSEVTVQPKPANASVRFLDVPVEYAPAVRVPVGDYQIEVAARGYATDRQTHRLRKGVNVIDVTLERNRGSLTVNVTPAGANVALRVGESTRIVGYQRGVRLPTGRVEVRVQKAGYRTVLRPVILGTDGTTVNVHLERFDVLAGQTIQDVLDTGAKGPWVIILPPGRVRIGEPDGDDMSALAMRTVEFDEPFAMGVTEVTLGEFRRYANAMGGAVPRVKGMDTDDHPIANVSWREAVGYTEWLTRQTGNIYRLPSEREWAYAAIRGAATGQVCELGNTADRSLKKVFRRWQISDCDDGHTRSAPVGSYRANELGLHDMLGNVKEWVSDCGVGGCSSRIARGSAWSSVGDDLRLTYRESYDRPADTRGFRVVREL